VANTRGLDPQFQQVADALVRYMRAHDARYVITSGLRTRAEQEELWAKWLRGDPSQPYRPLPPGRSQHERGFAVDIARMGVDARIDADLRAWGAWWRQLGGVWGGEGDPVHFEAPRAWTGR
jgi:LAS superfamily LD-carboxypeptidase LdcB